ncbi:MAG: MATE family efflux transporter [Cyanobacteria bacterium J069]|nr:MAG: MATE family efflux transporter [Cyanobacteria bacterium J069]
MKPWFTRHTITTESRELFWLALPLAGAQLSQSATGFVDTVMMGRLGSESLAAGGLCATYFVALLLLGGAIVAAVSPLAAEAYGAKNPQRVGAVNRQGLWLALLLSLPMTALIWHGDWLLSRTGQPAGLLELGRPYLRAIALGYLPGVGFAALKSTVSALSRPRPIILIMLGGMLINMTLNYTLTLGKFGLPQLGLAGIGWASAISLWSMFGAIALYIQQPSLRPYGLLKNLHQFEPKLFQELVRVGLPIGILAAVEVGLFTVTTFLVGQLGTVSLAAHQVALQTAAVTFTIPLGISFATTVLVGQRLGQRQFHTAKLAGYLGIGMGSLFMGIMALIFWLMPETIVSLYLDVRDPANAEVVNLAKKLLWVAAMFQLVDGIQVTATGALRGLKDTQIPMLIGILAYWGVGLTSGYWLGMQAGMGAVGLWWGLALGLTVAAIVLPWRFSRAKADRMQPLVSPGAS